MVMCARRQVLTRALISTQILFHPNSMTRPFVLGITRAQCFDNKRERYVEDAEKDVRLLLTGAPPEPR